MVPWTMDRAYSTFDIKSVDGDRRVFTGIASTPTPDRDGDIVEPLGVKFTNPLPLLLFHDHRRPVGECRLQKATPAGITFEASIPAIAEAGLLRDRVEEAWQSVKARLIKGVSIGFRPLPDGVELLRTGGLRLKNIEIHELSLVSVPANQDAVITTIKSIDAPHLAAFGMDAGVVTLPSPGVSGHRVVKTQDTKRMAPKPIAEQIASYEATRAAKSARMTEIMTKSAEDGTTLDAAQAEEYDGLEADVKSVDAHLVRMRALEATQKAAAMAVPPAAGADPHAAHAARGGNMPVITVKSNLDPGIEFARVAMCKMAAFLSQGQATALDFAKARYPDNPRVLDTLKAAIPAGNTVDTAWAGVLVDPANLASEFIEFLRPQTVIGKFGTNGIPSLRRVPFNIRVIGQTSGGDGYWVGQGAPKPLTKFDFNATTLGFSKVASIAVITDELARFSSPSAERLVRDALAAAQIARIDTDFIDPTVSAVTNVSPASITNGLTALSPSGTSADAARSDFARLINSFVQDNLDPSSLVVIMPSSVALFLSVQVNSLGQREFPDLSMRGGMVLGIPIITSQYAANQSGAGNMVIAVNAGDIFLADDGQVTIDASREASLQMLDNPTNNSVTATATTMVSMFQTNSMALRAERYINWQRRRTSSVAYMDDVNWGSVGSPA